VKNLKTCIAVHLYFGYIMSKAQRPNVNNGLDTSRNEAVNLAGLIVTSANIVGYGRRVNSDPDKNKWVGKLPENTPPPLPWVNSDLC
jgi:hypothetical protein